MTDTEEEDEGLCDYEQGGFACEEGQRQLPRGRRSWGWPGEEVAASSVTGPDGTWAERIQEVTEGRCGWSSEHGETL